MPTRARKPSSKPAAFWSPSNSIPANSHKSKGFPYCAVWPLWNIVSSVRSMKTPASHIRLLLVDDHPLYLLGLVDVMGDAPEVEIVGQARTAEAAIRQANQLKPDVVLMDINLPDGSG